MPSIISKILHRKKRSSSTSSGESDRSRGSHHARQSLDNPDYTPSRLSGETPRQGSVQSRGVSVNPARPAPPPPTDGTVVIPAEDATSPETVNTDRELPALPRSDTAASREIKDVESRRQRTLMDNAAGDRNSVEGEVGRESTTEILPAQHSAAGLVAIDSGKVQSVEVNGVPARGSSLAAMDGVESDAGENGTGTAYHTPGDVMTARGNAMDRENGLEKQMAGLKIGGVGSVLQRQLEGRSFKPVSGSLEEQRVQMADKLLLEAKARKDAREPLSEFGRQTFEKAGFADRIGTESTVEVTTKWLKPIVHERIHRKIHTEYSTVVTRHIHRHHVYPKILFIEDPNPAILPPRHRIFSPQTGKWHEVIGDDAAIAILGEDVFHNGPKEHRQERRPYEEFENASQSKSGPLAGLTDGMTEEEMLAAGFGLGGKGKVVEREGVKGGKMSEWKPAHWDTIFGHKKDSLLGVKDEVGVAL